MRKIVETFPGGNERRRQVLTGPNAFGGWHVVAVRGKVRELLQGDVGVAAQVLNALVGDVVTETRQVEGQKKPEMVARFSINAIQTAEPERQAVGKTGSDRRGPSRHRPEQPSLPLGSKHQTGADVLDLELRKITNDLRLGHARGKILEDVRHGDSQPTHARLAAAFAWIDGDPIQKFTTTSRIRRKTSR